MRANASQRSLPILSECALHALAGASMALSFAPFDLPWLQLPLLALLIAGSARATCWKRAFLIGLCFGLGQYVHGLSFIFSALFDKGRFSLGLSLFLFCCITFFLALFHAMFSTMAYLIARRVRSPWLSVASTASAWALAEWLRGWVFTGFPWLALGYAHAGSVLKYWAQLGGVLLIGFCVAWAAAVLAAWRQRRLTAPLAMALLAMHIAPAVMLSHVDWTVPTGAALQVALLQGGREMAGRRGEQSIENAEAIYASLLKQPLRVDLIVFPEASLLTAFQDISPFFSQALASAIDINGAEVLLGASYWLDEKQESYAFSALHLSGAMKRDVAQAPASRYDKSHLIPFAEYTPQWVGWLGLGRLDIPLNMATPGTEAQKIFRVKAIPVAVSLCYEFLFGDEIRRNAGEASILINLGNNAWFSGSAQPAQWHQIAQMRAIETGRPVIRVDHVGVTAIIDELGVDRQSLAPYRDAVLQSEVAGRNGNTPYVAFGQGPWLCVWALLLILGLAWPCASEYQQQREAGIKCN